MPMLTSGSLGIVHRDGFASFSKNAFSSGSIFSFDGSKVTRYRCPKVQRSRAVRKISEPVKRFADGFLALTKTRKSTPRRAVMPDVRRIVCIIISVVDLKKLLVKAGSGVSGGPLLMYASIHCRHTSPL